MNTLHWARHICKVRIAKRNLITSYPSTSDRDLVEKALDEEIEYSYFKLRQTCACSGHKVDFDISISKGQVVYCKVCRIFLVKD
jgi:hypothetical protein